MGKAKLISPITRQSVQRQRVAAYCRVSSNSADQLNSYAAQIRVYTKLITKNIVTSNSGLALIVVSVASGVGCCLAVAVSNKFSKDKTYVNVIMSDNLAAMQSFRDFLAEHHITNVAADSYTLDWSQKTITITAYAETKEQSRLIDRYIGDSDLKFKRVVSKH